MKLRHLLVIVTFVFINTNLRADENKLTEFSYNTPQTTQLVNDDWISTHNKPNNNSQDSSFFTLEANKLNISRDELAFAWNFSDSLKINLSIFENFSNDNYVSNTNQQYTNNNFTKSLSKLATQLQRPTLDTNRNISGYKFGISSEFGMGNNYTLNIGFDYGQLEDADIVGFNTSDVNTSTFELGFRKSKFGASVLTDTYNENNTDDIDYARLGFELDWYFSDDTIISFGSKQRVNSNSNNSGSLETLTGDIQYIKFQHNL